MSDSQKMPPDLRAKAMKEAVQKYSGEKSMQNPNTLDSLINPKDGHVTATTENP